ncbi:Myb/SANT-like domain-containing protein [Arachis hypogaea]|nr:Myb/SANT-like domain-containing protein [Arachis hypogaea]
MEELVIEERRADAGQFRPGSFEKLVTKMNEKFPADMAACSDFGWDDVKQCVVVDNKEILAAYLKESRFPCNHVWRKYFVKKEQVEWMLEFLPQQSNFVASSSERKQEKKPHSSKATKDTNMMKELTKTLKYVFDQHGKRLDAFALAMINTHEEKKVGDMLSELGFTYDEIISIALKFSTNPQLEKTFWSLGYNQKAGFARAILYS